MATSNDKKVTAASDKPVQERLLDAAEELFCEHGFAGTSVRDLAAAANCNIASVNYYFGGKENLYAEVWRRHLVQMRNVRIESINNIMARNDGKPELEDLLRSFAHAFIGPLVDETKARRLMKLMTREMLDQHLPANMLVEEVVKPTMVAMGEALMKTCATLDKSRIPLVIFSIAGQLIHAVRIRAMFDRTDIAEALNFDLNEAVEHIVKFSAAGIRAYAEGKTE